MAINDIDRFREQLPHVFSDRELPPDWDDDWIFVPVEDPDAILGSDIEVLDVDEPVAPGAGGILRRPDEPFWAGQANWVSPVPAWEGGGAFPGAPGGTPVPGGSPPPDALAFYLPFHYFHPSWWGVYLTLEGVLDLAYHVYQYSGGVLTGQECVVAARQFLYSHEAFHHHVEVFALRLETTHRIRLYAAGFEREFRARYGTDECLEEALANGHALRRVKELNGKLSPAKRKAIDLALEAFVRSCPPGYRRGVECRSNAAFGAMRRDLAEACHSAALAVPRMDPDVWRTASHMFTGISRQGSRTNYLVRRDSPLASRLKLQGRYARYRDVRRRLEKLGGCRFVRPGKGAHEIWARPDGQHFTLPRHPGDLATGTLSAIIRQAGLEMSVTEFLAG